MLYVRKQTVAHRFYERFRRLYRVDSVCVLRYYLNRGDRHNRDMLIDSSLLGPDGTAALIEEVARKVFNS